MHLRLCCYEVLMWCEKPVMSRHQDLIKFTDMSQTNACAVYCGIRLSSARILFLKFETLRRLLLYHGHTRVIS